ncbi:MAG: hypothetical protein HWD59_02315 [Coxiellaceae bacterium]|nr:MAG: hypothetical protein HWD59_02315 [Coxiellaceae bacterium]
MEEMMASGHIDCDLDIKLLSKNGVGPESEPKSELIRRNRERLLDEVNKKITDDNLLFYKQLLRLIKELLIIENITILQEFINEQPFIYENNNEIATIIGRTEKTDKFTTFQALYNHVIAAIDKERKEISRFDHLQFLELELSKNINSAKANAVIYGLQLLFHGITNLEELSSLISAYRQSVTTAELAQPTDIAQTIVNSRIQPLSPEATTLKTASETDTDSLHDETLSSEPDDTPQEIKSIRTRAKTALTNLKGGLEKLFNDFEHFSKINASLNDQEIKKSVQKAAGTLRGGKTTVVNPPKYSAIRKHSEAPTLSKESNNNNEYIPDEINYGFIAGKAPESLKEFFEQYTKVSPSQKIENQKRELERIIAKYDPESDAVNFITSTLSQIVDFCAESHKAYNALIQTPVNDKNLSIEAMLHLLQLAESGISMTELLAQAAPILAKHKIRPINSKTCTNNDEFNKKLYKRFNKDQTVDLIKNIEIFLDATKTFIANCGPAITLLSNSGVRIGISAFRGYFTQTFTEYAAICKLLQRALIVVEADKSLQQKAIDCSTACHEAAQQVNGFNVNQLLREQPNIDLGPGIVTQKTALQKATFACLDPYEKETCSTMLEMTNLCMNVRDGYYKLNNLPYEKTNLPIIKVLMLAKLLEKNPPNLLAEVNEVLLKAMCALLKKQTVLQK